MIPDRELTPPEYPEREPEWFETFPEIESNVFEIVNDGLWEFNYLKDEDEFVVYKDAEIYARSMNGHKIVRLIEKGEYDQAMGLCIVG